MTPLKDTAIKNALSGDWKNAISTNRSLLDNNPKDSDALNRLALAFMARGEFKHAKETYQKVLEIDALNPIALKNLRRIKEKGSNKNSSITTGEIANVFLEETGKTKVVELVNTAQPSLIQTLRTGQIINLSIKRSRIFISAGDNRYIGVLPDDIGQRLIKFIKSGNKYEAYIKSTDPHKLTIFIRELKRVKRLQNQPSFINTRESAALNLISRENAKKQNKKSTNNNHASLDAEDEE